MKKFPKKGFTLVETLVMIFIFVLIALTFYQVISLGTRYIIFSKNRLGAIALANEKMEIARNLDYDDVGIRNGACAGNILQDEDVTENGRTYHVHTLATYIDDTFDGTLGGHPNDTAYKDYKLVKITVSWDNGGTDAGSVYVLSRFVPSGLETATSGDGILSINIFSDQNGGAGVPQASIHIINPDLNLDETIETDNSGNAMLVGAKESIQKYQINVSKSGYETVETYPPYPDTSYNPVDTNASVVAGALNVTNIAENQTSNLKVSTSDYFGTSVPNIKFSLVGGRKLGAAVIYPYTPVYNLNASDQTDSSGTKQYNSISPGQYTFMLDSSVTSYKLISITPASPFSLPAGQDLNLNVELAPKNVISLLVTVSKSSDNSLLSGAKVELSNNSGYDENYTTDSNGTAFFPESKNSSFAAGTYQLKITADGFQDYSGSINITGSSLNEKTVSMTAS